jgi:DnaJ-class molecular chaperone
MMPIPKQNQGEHWRDLGLAPGADPDRIKSAFRRLAKQVHPDCQGPSADHARFTALYRSYQAALAETSRPAPDVAVERGPGFRLVSIQREGLDLVYLVELIGRPRRLSLPHRAWNDCPDCWPRPRADCRQCHGLGRIRIFGMLHLDLPFGARRLRLRGRGELGPQGPGDLIVQLRPGHGVQTND